MNIFLPSPYLEQAVWGGGWAGRKVGDFLGDPLPQAGGGAGLLLAAFPRTLNRGIARFDLRREISIWQAPSAHDMGWVP